jgi:YihY family inner membrane protein
MTVLAQLKRLNKRIITLSLRKPLFHHAAAISFNVLICILPIALLLVSVLGFILNNAETYEQIAQSLRDLLPDFILDRLDAEGGADQWLHALLDPIISNRGVNGLIGFVSLSFFSQGLFSAIGHSLHDIFSEKDKKAAWRVLLRNYIAFGLVGSVFVGSTFILQTISIVDVLRFELPIIGWQFNISALWQWVNQWLSFSITVLLVFVLYRRVSGFYISVKTAFAGALIFTLLFETAKAALSWYFAYAFDTYQSLYQSYALILMIAFWLYYIGILFNFSAIIARALKDVYQW